MVMVYSCVAFDISYNDTKLTNANDLLLSWCCNILEGRHILAQSQSTNVQYTNKVVLRTSVRVT